MNISSDAGIHGVKGGAHYASAKAALQMFTTVTAAEWGRYGIRVNCIAVGAIASERVVQAWEVAGIDQADFAAKIPLVAQAGPTKWRGRSCSWSAMPPRTSRARHSPSTAVRASAAFPIPDASSLTSFLPQRNV